MLLVENLYLEYGRDVYRYLMSLTHNREDSEDMTSEVFLRAFIGSASYRGDASPRTWLFGIARNLWLTSLRKKRKLVSLDEADRLAIIPDLAGRIETKELAELIYEAIGTLPENSREVLSRRVKGAEYSEIAAALGISESSARVLCYRARLRVREYIESKENS